MQWAFQREVDAAWTRVSFLLIEKLDALPWTIRHITHAHLTPADRCAAFENGSVSAWMIWDPFHAAGLQRNGSKRIARPRHRHQRPAVKATNLRCACRVEVFDAYSLAEHQCVGGAPIRESLVSVGFVRRIDSRFSSEACRPLGRIRCATSDRTADSD